MGTHEPRLYTARERNSSFECIPPNLTLASVAKDIVGNHRHPQPGFLLVITYYTFYGSNLDSSWILLDFGAPRRDSNLLVTLRLVPELASLSPINFHRLSAFLPSFPQRVIADALPTERDRFSQQHFPTHLVRPTRWDAAPNHQGEPLI